MRRLIRLTVVVLSLLSLSAPMPNAIAGPQGCTGWAELQSFDFEQITVSATSIGFTAAKYAPVGLRQADMAVVMIETNPVRYRDDGVPPTAAAGQPIAAAASVLVCGPQNVKNWRAIRSGAADATASVSYYRAQ